MNDPNLQVTSYYHLSCSPIPPFVSNGQHNMENSTAVNPVVAAQTQHHSSIHSSFQNLTIDELHSRNDELQREDGVKHSPFLPTPSSVKAEFNDAMQMLFSSYAFWTLDTQTTIYSGGMHYCSIVTVADTARSKVTPVGIGYGDTQQSSEENALGKALQHLRNLYPSYF
ncbi:hypothetical protein D9611_001364 [Ephemerocybe angulata]|uniref:Uncharacterized protein n=1 Tax=Ephemerocybe angulata TaxID=980116 RepID=A0A8H5FML8_9AGAR|nr:hypothetical protein D9611_001364 [Tulosesus angulatus]